MTWNHLKECCECNLTESTFEIILWVTDKSKCSGWIIFVCFPHWPWLVKYSCFLPLAPATSWHFGSRKRGVVRENRRSYDAAVAKAQGTAFVYQKIRDQHHGVYWGWSCHSYWQEEEAFSSTLSEIIFSPSFIVYCSLIFHNICRKCWTSVWMKKDREARRLWQLLQRYLSSVSGHAMWIPCVSLEMPSPDTHFCFITIFIKLCSLICA